MLCPWYYMDTSDGNLRRHFIILREELYYTRVHFVNSLHIKCEDKNT
jgi:hypothetical protein